MSGTLRDLLGLAHAPRARFCLAATLGALTVLFGVGLMATAGYLISRAAERPPVLSLMVNDRPGTILRPRAADPPLPGAARLPRPRAAHARRGTDTVPLVHAVVATLADWSVVDGV
jgi:hypothetical protein